VTDVDERRREGWRNPAVTGCRTIFPADKRRIVAAIDRYFSLVVTIEYVVSQRTSARWTGLPMSSAQNLDLVE
jgi:hypothetical protein